MRKETKYGGGKSFVEFGIYEVYYTNGEPTGWTQDRMEPHGETLDELKEDLKWFQAALTKPVLDFDHEPKEDN